MTSINILHASDLHLSVHKQLRSPVDRLRDLDIKDVSLSGISRKFGVAGSFVTAWLKRMAASSYDPEPLEALAEFICDHERDKQGGTAEDRNVKLDAVVLTGDLATSGSFDDVEMVSKFLRARPNPKLPHKSNEDDYKGATLSSVKIPILYLPGNHDRLVFTREFHDNLPVYYQPGGLSFDKQVSNYKNNPVQEIEIQLSSPNLKQLRVVILAVDFTLEGIEWSKGPWGWLAQGMAYSDKRRALVKRTEELKHHTSDTEVLCVIWAMHFPPDFPGCPDYGKLLMEEKLTQEANRLGIPAILAGHTHQQLTYRNPGAAFWVYCCGTTTQYEPLILSSAAKIKSRSGNFFQIITVALDDDEVMISGQDYMYSASGSETSPRLMRWIKIP